MNSDVLTVVTDVASIVLEPGEVQEIQFIYSVTTERTATLLHMDLRLSNGHPASGWSLLLQSSDPALSPATDLTDASALIPDSSFGFTVWIVAPAVVTDEHVVTLHINSTVTTAAGDQVALTGDAPTSILTVRPVPPVADEDQVEPQGRPRHPTSHSNAPPTLR